MSLLIIIAGLAMAVAQAPQPHVQQVDLMPPTPRQEAPAATQPAPSSEAESEAADAQAEQPAALSLRSTARPSSQRIAAFWFILPGANP